MKKYLSLFTVLLISAVALGAKIGDDELVVGKPGSTADKTIKMGTQKIRSNQSSQKLEFTNDGTNYKAFGSGSGGGGGVDFLQDLNGDFEAGTTGWTNVGGTFTAISSGQLAGSISGQWDPSATAQTLDSSLITKLAGANGRSCSASFEYNWNGTLGHLTAAVLDQTNAVIATSTLLPTTSTGTSISQIPLFDCDAATQFKIRLTSTADAAAIKIDSAFIGYGRNSQQIAQAAPYLRVNYGSFTGSAGWQTYGGTGTVDVGNSANYVDGTKRINLDSVANYHVIFRVCNSVVSSNNVGIGLEINGVLEQDTYITQAVPNDTGCRLGTAMVTNNTINGFIRLRMYNQTGGAVWSSAQVSVFKFPAAPADATTFETSGWKVDVNIGGTGNSSLGTVAVPNYSEISDPNLNLVVNSGSLPAQIPCSGTNPSTGLTCAAGNEVFGVVFDAPAATDAFVCASFNHYANVGAASNVNGVFTVVETPNNSQTILQSNNTRVDSIIQNSGFMGMPHNNCGIMRFATAGKKTLRLMYEQVVSGSVTISQIIADRNPAAGDRDVHITVIPIGQQFPTPVFTDLQNSLRNRVANSDSGQVVMYSGSVLENGSTCSINRQIGGTWISSVSRNGVGDCTVNFASGFFNGVDIPICVGQSYSPATQYNGVTITPALMRFNLSNSAGTMVSASGDFVCYGRK